MIGESRDQCAIQFHSFPNSFPLGAEIGDVGEARQRNSPRGQRLTHRPFERHREEHAKAWLEAAVRMTQEGATRDQVLQRCLRREAAVQ